MPARKSGFSPQQFLTNARIWVVELTAFVVFVVWLYRTVAHELTMH